MILSNCYCCMRALLYAILRTLGKILRWFFTRLALVAVAITLAGAFFFLPRVTVEPSGPYDPSNPSPITFTISNVNIIPLRNIDVALR
jgi:hypothetical protein